MDKVLEVEVEKGWYAISINKAGEILCCYKTPAMITFENIQEF